MEGVEVIAYEQRAVDDAEVLGHGNLSIRHSKMARLRETLSQQTMATSSKGFALPGRKQPDFTPIAVRPTLREVPQGLCFRVGWAPGIPEATQIG